MENLNSQESQEKRQGRINRILQGIAGTEFGQGFGQAFNLDGEDRRDALFSRREAEGKASIPPRYQLTLSQHPLVDLTRQYASTTQNANVARIANKLGLPFDDGMFSFRANNGLNVGGAPSPNNLLPDLEFDESLDGVRKPTDTERARIDAEKKRVATLPFMRKLGYATGGIAQDFTTNATRNLWWLINAPQATVDLISEAGVATANPNLYREEIVGLKDAVDQGLVRYSPDYDEGLIAQRVSDRQQMSEPLPDLTGEAAEYGGYTSAGEEKDRKAIEDVIREEIYSRDNPKNYKRSAPGVRIRFDKGNKRFEVKRRKYSPTLVNIASMLPAAIGVNAGIGLMGNQSDGGLTGRQEGYQAVLPDELDPRQTSNAVAAVASSYLLGREGRIMDADDFLLERPDVTAGEYANYKGYLRDRDIDLNPFDDGRINLGGILKNNPDGVRGPEISFLGKSMGLNDTLIPTASAIGGSILGALAGRNPRIKASKPATIAALAGGGAAGLISGQLLGNTLEDQRRRNNFAENNPGIDYDTYKANARRLLDDKYALAKANPNAKAEIETSKTGFNKRNQQQALQTRALQQQAIVDQMVDSKEKRDAQRAIDKQNRALEQSQKIQDEIDARRKSKEDSEQQQLML